MSALYTVLYAYVSCIYYVTFFAGKGRAGPRDSDDRKAGLLHPKEKDKASEIAHMSVRYLYELDPKSK